MRLTDKTERYSMGSKTFKGKKKGFEVTISFSNNKIGNDEPHWYFFISKKENDYRYNSLWNELKFETQEECVAACELKIESIEQNNIK